MNPVEVEGKVRQLDNEVQAIYEMLAGIEGTQRRHSNRFQEIAARLDEIDQRLTGRLDTVDRRFDTIDGKVDMVLGCCGAAHPAPPEKATRSAHRPIPWTAG